MSVFKIWNAARDLKKTIIAGNLEELKTKGKIKLNLDEHNVCRVVLEECGTEVEEDDVLFQLKERTFLLLCADDVWSPGTNVQHTTASDIQNIEHTCDESGDSNIPECVGNLCTTPRSVTSRPPLPVFSDYVEAKLKSDQAKEVWGKMIHQAADFYCHKYPSMVNSSDYQMVGESLFRSYPAIGHDGTRTPWALFCKDLSQRIRWIRWNEKRKSALGNVSKERPAKLFRLGGSENQQNESTKEDFAKNVSELLAEIGKKTPNEKNIKILLSETHTLRMDWIKTLLDGRIQPILTKFPVFEYGKYIIYEFSLLIGKDAVKAVSERMESLQNAVEDIMGSRSSGELRMLPVLQYLEKCSQFDREKGTKSKSIIVTKSNVPEEDREKCIRTGREEAPHLILFISEEPPKLDDIVVAGDEVAIFTQAESVLDGVLVLIATYYIFHLNYPRIYSQILGILQEYVVNEPFSGKQSKKYRVLAKELNKKMRE